MEIDIKTGSERNMIAPTEDEEANERLCGLVMMTAKMVSAVTRKI